MNISIIKIKASCRDAIYGVSNTDRKDAIHGVSKPIRNGKSDKVRDAIEGDAINGVSTVLLMVIMFFSSFSVSAQESPRVQKVMAAIEAREAKEGFIIVIPSADSQVSTNANVFSVSNSVTTQRRDAIHGVSNTDPKDANRRDAIHGVSKPNIKDKKDKDAINGVSTDDRKLTISTNFYRKSPTVDKRVFIDHPDGKYTFTAHLDGVGNNPNRRDAIHGVSNIDSTDDNINRTDAIHGVSNNDPKNEDAMNGDAINGVSTFTNDVVERNGRWWLVYDNGTDTIAYNQSAKDHETIELKEWIYASKPNSPTGSQYTWSFGTMGRRINLSDLGDGRVGLHHEILVSGLDNNNEEERQRIIGVVRTALPDAYIDEAPLTAILDPVVYWTADGEERHGRYVLNRRDGIHPVSTLTVDITEPPQNYPLLIDPTLNYGAFMGVKGGSNYTVNALAVETATDEIYAGGNSIFSFSQGAAQAGTFNVGAEEGFVVEIADGAPPTLNWVQWLGSSSVDNIYALAVNGDEIYAGGYTASSASWETVGSTAGTYTSVYEGFVVEIADGSPPTVAWVQWLGGSGVLEFVFALAVNGDEIYAGGQSYDSASWETVGSIAGTFTKWFGIIGVEGFVVEIADGGPPTINWLQWLGGEDYSYDNVSSLVVNGDEIYAGGIVGSTTSFETVSNIAGTHNGGGSGEGFVVEITDGAPPTLNWVQWLGGSSYDKVASLAVNGDEIYAGGYTISITSWETVGSTAGTYNAGGSQEGFVVEIADADPPTVAWLQWLGGGGVDHVLGLAVNGDEIYAGGYSSSFTSWETVGSTAGTYNASSVEGFVVEITDGGPPTVAWLQWLGGDDTDQVLALAINGDEIYIGGTSNNSNSWDTAGSVAGTYHAGIGTGDFVIEVADAGPPTVAWVQWLTGEFGGATTIRALAVNSDEIYAGGESNASTWADTFGSVAGTYTGTSEGFVLELVDGASPTGNWAQWLGGSGADIVYALAVNGDEIYAGGVSTSFTSWETVGSTAGTYNDGGFSEGFVVEIADGGPPSVAWLQWLGGAQGDIVYALAVNGDEIYAGGYSAQFTSWETVGSTAGTFNAGGSQEGFVVEIADAGPPTVAWLQWLGASSADVVYALAVNGDEIYAGGYSSSFTSWETVGSTAGTYNASSVEGFVVEIADAGPPTVAWQQWLGGGSTDFVYALAVNGDEIYAGGYSDSFTSWETVGSTAGTYNDSSAEGFVVEIADGGPPSVAWRQWLGGGFTDYVYALAVNGDEIYAGGISTSFTSWETVTSTYGTFNASTTEGWVVEITDGVGPTIKWQQWLGGDGTDQVLAIAVNGDEIYASGYLSSDANWEVATPSIYATQFGFLVELADDVTSNFLYWVGGSGDSPTVNTNDWSTADAVACNDGAGDATAVPGSTDTAIFDADCDNNGTMTADWTVATLELKSGYSGTLATAGYEITVSGDLKANGGTINATDSGEGDTSTIYVGGNVDFTGGALTASDSTFLLNGTSSVTLTSATKTFNNLTLNDGLVGYWKLDEGAANQCTGGTNDACDSSGYLNDGAISGTVAYYTTSLPGLSFSNTSSLDFGGGWVDFNDVGSLDLGDSADVTITGWFNRDTFTTDDVVVAKRDGVTAGDIGWIVYLDDATDQLIFEISDGTDEYELASTSTFTATGWKHFAVVWDQDSAANSEIYLNGVADSATDTGTIGDIGDASNALDFRLGAESDDGDPLDGKLDDVRIYNRVLTVTEIAALARGDAPASTASGSKVTLQDALDVNGNLTLNSGELDTKSGSNYGINLAKGWINNGGKFTPQSGTVTLDGTSGTHNLQAGNQAFNILTVNGSGGTWQLTQDAMVSDDLNVSAGTLNLNGYDALVTDNLTASGGALNLGIGTSSVQGTLNFTGSTITPSSSTLILNPSTAGETLTAASQSLNNVVLTSTDGLIGWWKLDETAFDSCSGGEDACDSSGSGNHGTESGTPTISTDVAPVNFSNPRGLNFDGVDDYVTMGDIASVENIPQITISAWVKFPVDDGAGETLIGKGQSGFTAFRLIRTSAEAFQFDLANTTPTVVTALSQAAVLRNTSWNLITGVYDGVNVIAYVNGVAGTPAAQTGDVRDRTNPLCFGSWGVTCTNNNSLFQMDDVRIYNRALTSSEVAALYRGHPLSATGTITLQDTLDVNGNMVLGDGTMDASSRTINVARNWTNSDATFTYGTSTVDFDDNAQNNIISGSTTFYNLKIDTGTAKTVTFQSGKTQTIAASGSLTLAGAAGQLLTLAPATAATDWLLTYSGASQSISYVSVTYSDASGGTEIDANDGTNTDGAPGSTNTNWSFTSDAINAIFFDHQF